MEPSFRPLPVKTVARALTDLPAFQMSDAGALAAARTDLARAIASGQDAAQLKSNLATAASWFALDLRKAAGSISTAPVRRIDAAVEEKVVAEPPTWAASAAKAAVQAKSVLRVAVLDRDPAGMSSLSLPAWAQGQKSIAAYGPLLINNAEAQITFQKWIIVYIIPVQMVSFVRGGTTLFVAPLAASGNLKTVTLAGGSVWINVSLFDASAPADAYAGVVVDGGTLSSDLNLTFGAATVTVPAAAKLTLEVVPSSGAASTNPAVQVSPPASMMFGFPGPSPATGTVAPFAAQICGDTFNATPNGQPLVYNNTVQTLAIPCNTDQTQFTPEEQAGTLAQLSGSAPLLAAGWALQVTQSAPNLLGNALSSGIFYLGCAVGVSVQWVGLTQPEADGGAIILASSNFFLFWTAADMAPSIISTQEFDLWNGQYSPSKLTVIRGTGSGLVYEVTGAREVIELGAVLGADLDRPLLADGNRVPLEIPGLITLTSFHGKLRMFAYGAFPPADVPKILAAHPNGFPIALDNAFLKVSVPLLLVIEANITAPTNSGVYVSSPGAMLVGFLYQIEFPFLPDPYTSAIIGQRERGDSQVGGLLAEIAWTKPDQVFLRMIDLEHPHPLQLPTSEASSDLPASVQSQTFSLRGGFQLGVVNAKSTPPSPAPFPFQQALQPEARVDPPPPQPPPAPAGGFRMLDVSTRASLLGVEVIGYNFETAAELLTIDGLSARTWAVLAPMITLPAISWEPMYNLAKPVPASPTNKLLHPPNDGPMCGVGVDSVTLVPVSPIQSLGAILTETQKDPSLYGALLTLPFGTLAGIVQPVGKKGAPPATLTQPTFDVASDSGDVTLTGAYQLTMRPPKAPANNPNAPIFSGKTYTRTLDDDPPLPGLSYGEQVMGRDVGQIFWSRFNNPGSTVPVKRYDLTGYGASLFSDWINISKDPTDILEVNFETTVGRTSHEVIQAQSVIYPWGIKVVRTITIDRLNSGSVERTDSGWLAASDGLFVVESPKNDFTAKDVHAGVIDRLLKVKNISEFGVPLETSGTFDYFPPPPPAGSGIVSEPSPLQITLQPVTFDADVAINTQHQVMLGGSKVEGLDLKEYTAVPSKSIVGYIGLTALYHLSLDDLVAFLSSLPPDTASGPLSATLNLGNSHNVFRCVQFAAEPADDTKLGKKAIVISALGLPKLPQGSAWSVAVQGPGDQAPHALPATQAIPVIQANAGSGSPDTEAHFADPSDIFRLAKSPPAQPQYTYGFLQDVSTQKQFLARPYVTHGDQHLSLRHTPQLADPGVLLGAVSSFPSIASALPLSGLDQLISNTNAVSLQVDRWFDTFPPPKPFWQSPPAQTKITSLINTSVATVDLVYRWRLPVSGDDPPEPTPPPGQPDPDAMIHITLGQPGLAWSIDIYQVALVLTLPGISSTPALWIEGSFHADADTLPNFPDLQVFYDGPLQPITKFFSTLQTLGSALGLSEGTGGPGGLNVAFADGKLTIQETFNLGTLPLGPGEIENISLDMGGSINLPALSVDYMIGIGSPDAPVHWIVDPMSGTGCLQAGVQNGGLAVLVQLGIGLGLSIDLGIASGSASITIAFQVQITNTFFQLLILLTGQAEVDVFGGLASCSITISVGLGLQFPMPETSPPSVTALGTASVGIHLSICWVISIDWTGSWSFSHQFSLPG